MNDSINKIEIPNLRIDNYKFSSFANFLFDDNFISKIKDKKDNDFFNHLPSYQETFKVLEKESAVVPILIEGFADDSKILELIAKTLNKHKVIQFKEKDKNGFFIKISNKISENYFQFNLESNLEKGAYLNITIGEINLDAMLQALQVEFNNDLFSVIKYFHFLRLQKQVKLSLQTDLTKLLIAKKAQHKKLMTIKKMKLNLLIN